MHDIVTGAKHFTVSRPKSDMSGSSLDWQDVYADTYRDSYGVEMLMVEFASGDSHAMLALLGEVLTFWVAYFSIK
jgi:hypothetical protein